MPDPITNANSYANANSPYANSYAHANHANTYTHANTYAHAHHANTYSHTHSISGAAAQYLYPAPSAGRE